MALHCLPFCLHLLDALLYGKATLFKFLGDYSRFFRCQNFLWFFVVISDIIVIFINQIQCYFSVIKERSRPSEIQTFFGKLSKRSFRYINLKSIKCDEFKKLGWGCYSKLVKRGTLGYDEVFWQGLFFSYYPCPSGLGDMGPAAWCPVTELLAAWSRVQVWQIQRHHLVMTAILLTGFKPETS